MKDIKPKRFNYHGKLKPYDLKFEANGQPVVYLTLRHDEKGLPNYVKTMMEKLKSGVVPSGRVAKMNINHDNHCGVYDDGFCDCNAEVTF